MKITDVRAAGLSGGTPAGGWSNELRPKDSVHTLVAVQTDDGTVGFGSVFSSEALVQAALDELRPLCVGMDAVAPDHVTETLHRATFWLGRGGAVTHAISGIDIALWDVFGQVTGQPVSRLLGGCWRTRVRPYASVLIEDPPVMAERLRSLRAAGFTAFKIGWGSFGRVDHTSDEQVVATARDAVGAESLLMVDAGASDGAWSQGLKWALRTAEMLATYDVAWFEEPLRPDALRDYVTLRTASPVPIAGGEVLTRRQSFIPYLTEGAFDIVQPDVTKVGGISEQRRIAWLADDFDVAFVGHGWNTALGVAADLHLAAALPTTELVEFTVGSAYIERIVRGGWALDGDGLLEVPLGPGLGVELDREGLRPFLDDVDRFMG